MSPIRLYVLLAMLGAIVAFAVWYDHPAPAWGRSQLPELFWFAVVLVTVAGGIALLFGQRREDK